MIKKKILSEKYANMAYEIFCSKNWEIEYSENENSSFDTFCERLAMLDNDEQRELVLDLTKDYMKISMSDYEHLLIKAWKEYLDCNSILLNNGERFCICPIMSNNNCGKLKSGTVLLYLCESLELKRFQFFSMGQIRLCQTPNILVSKESENEFSINRIVLIDDYIGSGESALECIEFLKKNKIDKRKIDIVSLVAQEEAICMLKNEGVQVYTSIIRKKGISNKYHGKEIQQKIRLMKDIENNMNIDEKFSLGYNKTEALISLIKTPNNTFPVFWYENKDMKAIFPRKNNIKTF